ncbi:MAG: hypothetical protein MK108_04835 [Mariniblastus sp.]|nr:hypothetical protein [Mariniblastus sp.]
MSRLKVLPLLAAMIFGQLALFSEQADAGPLLDWLRGLRNRCVSPFNDGCEMQTVGYAPNACGLQPGQCQTTCMKTCSRVVVNYVPCTAYRTCYKRVPVTQYKPVTKTDPCTGCTVTCMRPCTTYTYQSQRIPYTTYRPVYRTETYKVPVTTITNDCATNASCSTCPTPMMAPMASGCSSCAVPQQGAVSTGTTYTPLPSSGTSGGAVPTPADIPAADVTPSLNPQTQQRPLYDRQEIQDTSKAGWALPPTVDPNLTTEHQAPARIDVAHRASPIRRQWTYSPVKLAGYTSTVDSPVAAKMEQYQGAFSPSSTASKPAKKMNTMWKSIDW